MGVQTKQKKKGGWNTKKKRLNHTEGLMGPINKKGKRKAGLRRQKKKAEEQKTVSRE